MKGIIGMLIVVFVTFFGLSTVRAQYAVPDDSLEFVQIAQNQGLSQLNVTSIAFGPNGYLWAGTEDGLNRFNGYKMTVIDMAKNNSELGDDIRGLLFFNDTLWLATNSKSVAAYILSQNRFITFHQHPKIKGNASLLTCNNIFKLNDTYILVSTLKNCLLVNRKTLELTVIPLPDQNQNDYVLSVFQRTDNSFLIGTYFNGIMQLNLDHKTINRLPVFKELRNNSVYALHEDGTNGLYIGTEKGLFHYQYPGGKLSKIPTPGEKKPIRVFFDWDKDHILIGHFNGLFMLDKKKHLVRSIKISGPGGSVYNPVEVVTISKDVAGGIWLGTEGKGMFYHHPYRKKFKPYRIELPQHYRKNFISIFNFLREGRNLWMATQMGFVKHRLGTHKYKLYITNRLGYTLAKDKQNNIWGGGFGQGLQRYNRTADRFDEVHYSKNPILDEDVIQITPISKDSMWIHTWSSGIFTFNPKTREAAPLPLMGRTINRSRISYFDSANNLWVGSINGVYKVAPDQSIACYAHNPNDSNSLSNDRIFGIVEDLDKNIWIGTAKGLNRIDHETDSVTRYLQQIGLPNDFIYGVLCDKNGNIWVSTNYGISMLDMDTGKFKNYTEDDGLQNNEFNGKAVYEDSLGHLYFGGMNGFNIIHPDSIPINNYVGKTIIEDVQLFGQKINKNIVYTDTLVFKSNQNVLTFSYAAINFLLPEKCRYQFMMEGFENEWRPITHERSTTYTNLSPGTYTFKVKGSNNELLWGKPDSLTIIIESPWYATALFKIMVAALVLLLLLSIFLYRNYSHKKESLRLQQLVEKRTKELSVINQELQEAFGISEKQKESIAFLMRELNHRVKNNLQLIISLLDMQKVNTDGQEDHKQLQAAQTRIFAIAKIHDLLSFQKTDDKLMLDTFVKKLSHELVQFMEDDVKLTYKLEPLYVDQKEITPLGIILNELITNTMKHGFKNKRKNKEISITVTKEDQYRKMRYHDNGEGLPDIFAIPQHSLGMVLIHNLTAQLGGKVEILNGQGTTIVIYF